MSKRAIGIWVEDSKVFSISTGADSVYLYASDPTGTHISRHDQQTHLRSGRQPPEGVHWRAPMSAITDEPLARIRATPGITPPWEMALLVPGMTSAFSHSFEQASTRSDTINYRLSDQGVHVVGLVRDHLLDKHRAAGRTLQYFELTGEPRLFVVIDRSESSR